MLGPVLVLLVVATGALPVAATRLLADLTGFVGAGVATAAFAGTASRSRSLARGVTALGLGSWCAGQGIWSWHRFVDGRALTFPDLGNVLFLVLPVCIAAALLVAARRHAGERPPEAPTRLLVFDALLLCAGMLGMAWQSTLGVAVRSTHAVGNTVWASLFLLGDLGLITLALVLALGLRHMWRHILVWVLAGLVCIALSDAVYASVLFVDQVGPPWADAGYLMGPWLLAIGALMPDRAFNRREAASVVLLPYLPVAATLALTVWHTLTPPHRPSLVETYFLIALLCLIIVRQLVSQRRLAAAHQALAERARTDALTSAANRAGLEAAYRHARQRDHDTALGLVLCDLDQFKAINDTYGHITGDILLQMISARLQQCVRPTDLVVRFGGDEFVLLLDPAPPDPTALTTRLAEAIATPITLDGHAHHVTASFGYSTLHPDDELPARLATADQQMYAAKTSRQ
jgi:diguanylate cyclase (GGDEF)-like protein